jgi:hypothetical protein
MIGKVRISASQTSELGPNIVATSSCGRAGDAVVRLLGLAGDTAAGGVGDGRFIAPDETGGRFLFFFEDNQLSATTIGSGVSGDRTTRPGRSLYRRMGDKGAHVDQM